MRLTAKSLESLTGIITGDSRKSPYRSGPQLVGFFNDFGESDLYGQGFPSRAQFARAKLDKFNGTDTMKDIVSTAFDFIGEDGFNAENVAYQFNQILSRDGFRLVKKDDYGWMEGDREVRINPRFEVSSIGQSVMAPTSLVAISHEAITEQVRKASQKIESGDYSGAITNAYTLVEHLLKLLLAETATAFKETEGDIRALYKALQPSLNLDPAKLEEPLKPIAGGFQSLIGGLYEMANKGSDRHARRFNPARHHAKLAVNAAFALCDFLVESRDYQKARAANALEKEDAA
ncbi:abortive infection family protein [Altererythrobacter sp. H2]|uniref:abortive infection family protein n=1 Tax=Altererythrobacter sp. H2 TaxID=3108391 RepID=UPI002B4BE622|nr:abortive infection family protein [Altererythrobacter sp. H2]WRK94875.1 abortive infection family protein [Altererythrobacter sp. H2]